MADSSSTPPTSSNLRMPHHSLGSTAADDTSLITVILPSQSITLRIPLPPASTVNDLKTFIRDACPGKPAQSGQRIIWKGRFLRDEEMMEDVVKNAIGDPTVYLAVHPTSWTDAKPTENTPRVVDVGSSKPAVLPTTTGATGSKMSPSRTSSPSVPLLSLTTAINVPQQFIVHQHTNAIRLLANQPLQPWLGPGDFRSAKRSTRLMLAYSGVGSPATASLEDLYMKVQENGGNTGGVEYSFTIVDNLPFLTLVDPTAVPTPLQKLALEVLTYTYPLLPLLPTIPATMPSMASTSRRLQALDFAGRDHRFLHIRHPRRPWYQSPLLIRSSILILTVITNPTRLLIPIILIVFRGAFVMYIFGWTPDRSLPWFSVVLAWMVWEIWSILRVEAARLHAARVAAGRAQPVVAPPAVPAADAAVPAVDVHAAPPNLDLEEDQDVADLQPAERLRRLMAAARPPAQNGNADPDQIPRPPRIPGPAPAPAVPAAGLGEPHAPLHDLVARVSGYHLQWEREQLGIEPIPPPPRSLQPQEGQPENPPDQTHLQGPVAVPPHLLKEPTFQERCLTFVVMFWLSVIPEVWAKRGDALRLREGQVREVYGRTWEHAEGDEDERRKVQAERRRALTGWRRDYVQRVIGGIGQDVDL